MAPIDPITEVIWKYVMPVLGGLVLAAIVRFLIGGGDDNGVKEDASNSTSNNAPSMGAFTGYEPTEAALAMRKKIADRKKGYME